MVPAALRGLAMWFVFVNTVRSIAFAILLNGGQMTRLIEEPLAVVMSLVAVLLGGVPAWGGPLLAPPATPELEAINYTLQAGLAHPT